MEKKFESVKRKLWFGSKVCEKILTAAGYVLLATVTIGIGLNLALDGVEKREKKSFNNK